MQNGKEEVLYTMITTFGNRIWSMVERIGVLMSFWFLLSLWGAALKDG